MAILKWRSSMVDRTCVLIKTAQKEIMDNNPKKAKLTQSEVLLTTQNALIESGLVFKISQEASWRDDDNNLVRTFVFNADTLFWENAIYVLEAVMTKTMPTHGQSDTMKIANLIFQWCYDHDKYVPEPYTGSRYLLFTNGIYDAEKRKLLEIKPEQASFVDQTSTDGRKVPYLNVNCNVLLNINGDEKFVHDVGFTAKHLHNFKLDLNAPCPSYVSTMDGVEWTPREWLLKTANNNIDQARYILEVMGAMLTPNHSFNAFVEINGLSNSGKTTLINIVSAIYNNRKSVLQGYTLDDLNDTFPFRGMITENTAFVHITETNGARLKNSAISLVNSFANTAMQMKQMGSESLTLTPPPFLVMEGKGWLLFDSVKTGIARRLLPIDITNANTAGYASKRYRRHVFEQPKVLAYFAKEIVLAYSNMTNGSDDFTFTIDDLDTLPEHARLWHHNATNAGDENMNRFVSSVVYPTIQNGIIDLALLHKLYEQFVTGWLGEDIKYIKRYTAFREIIVVHLQLKFDIEPLAEQLVIKREDLGIDLEAVEKKMPMPEELKNYGNSMFGKYESRQAYQIKIRPETTN